MANPKVFLRSSKNVLDFCYTKTYKRTMKTERQKDKFLIARVTAEEWSLCRRAARAAKKSMGAWLRELAFLEAKVLVRR
jgi:hypothetical protein